jgi:signal peptidase I
MVRRREIAEALSTVLLILLALACVATSLAPHFGWSVDAVFSGSMEPALKVGGVVVPVEAEDIKVRGIITFYSPLNEQLTSHRVIAVEEVIIWLPNQGGMPTRMPTLLSSRLRIWWERFTFTFLTSAMLLNL